MILRAPDNMNLYDIKKSHSVFLAGGISKCPNWQDIVSLRLEVEFGDDLIIINPRREDYHDSDLIAREQIRWEHQHIKLCNHIIFWFCPPTDNPITLFEFGKELAKADKEIFLGIHPEYPRRLDVMEQAVLEYPPEQQGRIYESLDDLIDAFIEGFNKLYRIG